MWYPNKIILVKFRHKTIRIFEKHYVYFVFVIAKCIHTNNMGLINNNQQLINIYLVFAVCQIEYQTLAIIKH